MSPQTSWSWDPIVLVGVLALAVIYGMGWRRARAAGTSHPPRVARQYQLAQGELMVMHMVQHMLLLDIAPILLILGLTKVLLRPVTRRVQTIERRAGFAAHPAFAVLLYAGLLWLWHIPAMYDHAQGNGVVHILEHACFFSVGLLYWWHVLSPIRSRYRFRGLGSIGYMTASKLLVGLLGVVLAFSPTVLYSFYAHKPHYWGLTPLEDQNLAGLVMALEQSIVMGIALVFLFVQMLTESEREAQRQERFEVA